MGNSDYAEESQPGECQTGREARSSLRAIDDDDNADDNGHLSRLCCAVQVTDFKERNCSVSPQRFNPLLNLTR
jgi:hypothetical protein